ncbi:isoleucine--tRNA ligase [Thalassobacillus sp. CUG 92003]|uniref:isoleucine--tRNA ligase n=1 Tax=Thalassobacillus sp. CUG 92003 TaxID=2736641 RepID=UPI0015E7BB10|nr:isoleucine--tRNA ligase [Thalassobacillus sp. CUG 92003]
MREVNAKEHPLQRENRVKSVWKEDNVFQRSMDEREGKETFVFYEGPPTANGLPHAGHVLGRVIKDFVARYKTMQGYQVLRKGGWDTHGLPVELEVEKQLGLSGKQEVEEYGIEAFIEKCKESVFEYERQWREFTESIGYWLDMDDPYVTLENNYIESIWYILSDIHKRGLLDKGHRVTPYCPSCQTTLSSHEVAQGYEDVKDLSVTAKFKVAGKDEYFLGWTTTPWTLPANVALAVYPQMTYVKAEKDGETYIVAETLAEKVLGEDHRVLSTHKGNEFTGLHYEAPFQFIKPERGHLVVEADFVNDESGTGLVHVAPAYGEDDYQVVLDNNLSFFNVVDKQGQFTSEIKPFAGRFVKDCDVDIVKYLADAGLLFHKEKYEHSYPHCWRCDSPLLYYAIESWFIKTTALKDQFLKNNDMVEWYPDHIKHGRFGNFLENMVDWNIGRNRFWGTPLNVWECESCQHQYAPESVKDLQKHALGDVADDIELHKPYVDAVQLECGECGGTMNRAAEVIDVWFDSGAMPFAQYHYPFENKELFKKQYPADVVCEGVDQTRGWFYSLLAVSTLFTGQPPYRRVLSTGHILDEHGRKMSKSKGNALSPVALVEEFGADALRWALLADSNPWNNKRFSKRVVSEAKSKVIDTVVNTHAFYTIYANIDKFDPETHTESEQTLMDRWILSRLQSVSQEVQVSLDQYDFTKAAKAIETFVDEMSNWYIRRSRDRFWEEGMSPGKQAAYQTLHQVLKTLSKLMAPFAPFLAEDIYHNLTGESVHLALFPQRDEQLVDEQLEKDMDGVLQVVELARNVRNSEAIKTKQPLSELIILPAEASRGEALKKYEAIIKDEINVKSVTVQFSSEDLIRYELKLNFREAGPKLGKHTGSAKKHLANLTDAQAKEVVEQGAAEFTGDDGEAVTIPLDLIVVETKADQGMAMASEKDFQVMLNTTITEDLRLEGLAREVIRVIQDHRKQLDLPIDLRVDMSLAGDPDLVQAIKNNESLIRENVLVRNLSYNEQDEMSEFTIGDQTLKLAFHYE